jgi:hypothetical protein
VGTRGTRLDHSEINVIEKFRFLSLWMSLQISTISNAVGAVTAMD